MGDIERDDLGIVVHGGPGCTCTASGEDPQCPHHGYEAVIARLEAQFAGAVAENEQLRADLTRVRGQRDALIEHEHVMTAEIDRLRAGVAVGMGDIERNTGGNWDSDRHPHEPKINRQLASNGACFVCELMEETRIAEQRLRGAVDALRDLLEWVDLIVQRRPGLGDIIVIANARRIVAERELLNP